MGFNSAFKGLIYKHGGHRLQYDSRTLTWLVAPIIKREKYKILDKLLGLLKIMTYRDTEDNKT
jgi:hypothetical protein